MTRDIEIKTYLDIFDFLVLVFDDQFINVIFDGSSNAYPKRNL
jgi:hypothetical protein